MPKNFLKIYVDYKLNNKKPIPFQKKIYKSQTSDVISRKNTDKKKRENYHNFLIENTLSNLKGLKKINFSSTTYWYLTLFQTVFFPEPSPPCNTNYQIKTGKK